MFGVELEVVVVLHKLELMEYLMVQVDQEVQEKTHNQYLEQTHNLSMPQQEYTVEEVEVHKILIQLDQGDLVAVELEQIILQQAQLEQQILVVVEVDLLEEAVDLEDQEKY